MSGLLQHQLGLWIFGHNGELLDSHLFFFDRYSDLADSYRQQGRIAKADKLAAIAEAYFQAAPDDDEPPEAAAMAMAIPQPRISTNAVSATRVKKPSSERSNLAPSLTGSHVVKDDPGLVLARQPQILFEVTLPHP